MEKLLNKNVANLKFGIIVINEIMMVTIKTDWTIK
jgi:hypothetical protein